MTDTGKHSSVLHYGNNYDRKSCMIQAWFKCGQKNLDHFQAKKLGGYLQNFLQTSLDDFYGISLYLQINFEIEILIIRSSV